MRKMSRLLMTVMVVASATGAYAQTTDVEAVPAKPIAGYDGGFFIQNEAGDYKMKIKGRIQPQYFFENGKRGIPAINTFRVRRAQVNFSGNLTKNWSYFALFQNSTSSGQTPSALFWLASVTYSPGSYFSMEMGTVTPPFDRLSMESSGAFTFVENSLVATQMDGIQDLSISRPAFGFDTGPGVFISGNIKNKLIYGFSVTNGNNPNGNSTFTSNFNKRMSGSARLQYNILKDPGYAESDLAWSESPAFDVAVGGGYMDQGGADAYSATTYLRFNFQGVVDTTFKYKGLSIIAAVYGRIQYCSSLVTNNNFTLQDAGYYAQAGYFVIPKKLELAIRGAGMMREGPVNDSFEYDGGVNWYIIGNSVKWQNTIGYIKSYDQVDGTQGQNLWRGWSMITLNI